MPPSLSVMKTKLCFLILLSFVFGLLSSRAQIPQGFNYQAVARLTTGDPIINTTLPVRITIQADSLGTSVIWQELHSSVITNGFGLITLILGKGARQAASNVATFSAIDWTVMPKFIKTEIDYSGWKTMGVTRFWSVPYSKIAENLGGPVKKLAVTGTTLLNDEALFEVKNKDGNTVFAVYNEGVRVYVADGAKGLKGGFAVGGFGTDKGVSTPYFIVGKDSVRVYLDTNPLTKKLKGGFAVGGYDLTKGSVQDYLDVNSDSVRIYIDSNPSAKGLKGGFAVGGYDMTKGTNTNYMNVNTDASGLINPSQNRILWYPLKNAFLTGKVLIESRDSVGENSFASGFESKSKGQYSQALGFKAIASGDYSTAIGKNAVAGKINSFAFGEDAKAKNEESYAIGRGAVASGYRSFAFGSAGRDSSDKVTDVTRALGDYSFAIGQGSHALGKGSFAIGLGDTAQWDNSFALGYKSRASLASTAIGWNCKADGLGTSAFGLYATTSGFLSISMGSYTKASGNYSIALGYDNIASGEHSTSLGYDNESSGVGSTTIGHGNETSGKFSMAIGGPNLSAPSVYEIAVGRYNTSYTPSSATVWTSTDRLFVIGNGNIMESNAMTVLKNGRIGLQTVTNPTYALELPNSSTIGVGQARAYAWATYSDGRAKSDQTTMSYGLKEIMMLSPSEYFHHGTINDNDGIIIQDEGKHDIGLIAQDVYDIIPEAVNKPENEEKELWSISYDKLVPVLVSAIKEQQQQIESQQKQIEELKAMVNALAAKND